jgi:pimeloyl-ACP methyl ester carboxylesterase
MSPKARRRVVETVGKVGAEFETVAHLSRTPGDYAAIQTPTRLIVGERSPRPARAIVDDLLNILPDAHIRELAGAGHMSPLTHPMLVSALVAEHIDAVETESLDDRTSRRSSA